MNNNELDLISLLSLSLSASITELHERLSELGFEDIRPVHGYLFKCLIPSGATGIEIAKYLGITKQAVSNLVDYLEKNGYVLRKPHPTDKRGKIIVLTARGWLVANAKEKILHDIETRWMKEIGTDRVHLLKEDLSKFIDREHASPLRLRSMW